MHHQRHQRIQIISGLYFTGKKSRRDAANWGFSLAFFCYQPYAATRRSISLLHPSAKNIMPLCGEAFYFN